MGFLAREVSFLWLSTTKKYTHTKEKVHAENPTAWLIWVCEEQDILELFSSFCFYTYHRQLWHYKDTRVGQDPTAPGPLGSNADHKQHWGAWWKLKSLRCASNALLCHDSTGCDLIHSQLCSHLLTLFEFTDCTPCCPGGWRNVWPLKEPPQCSSAHGPSAIIWIFQHWKGCAMVTHGQCHTLTDAANYLNWSHLSCPV